MEEQEKPRNIVIGQTVQEEKVILARQMRRKLTTTEAMLWQRLGRNVLGVHFRSQQVIDGFIADFYCHAAALVVEVDGLIHDPAYDAERDQVFGARGITVLRFTNEEVRERIGYVLACIRRHL